MKPKCKHYWLYEQSVWQAKPDNGSVIAVGRYCPDCGLMQTATTSNWRPLPKSYVDMRATLKKGIADFKK